MPRNDNVRHARLALATLVAVLVPCAASPTTAVDRLPPSSPVAWRLVQSAPASDADLRQVIDDYVGLYTREALPRWRALFLPTFTATYTNADGTVTSRTLDDFYTRQRTYLDTGRAIREELTNLRVDRQGPIATASADFVLYDEGATREGKLALQLIEERGRFKIASLVFTYHAGERRKG